MAAGQGFTLPSVFVVQGSRGLVADALALDVVIDDRPENCMDVAADSNAGVFLLWRGLDKDVPAAVETPSHSDGRSRSKISSGDPVRSRFLESDGTRIRRTRVAQARTQATGEYWGTCEIPQASQRDVLEIVDQTSCERGAEYPKSSWAGCWRYVESPGRSSKSIATR